MTLNPKPTVIVDPHFRNMKEVFHPDDLARLHRIANVVWAQDTPMPQDAFDEAIPEASAVICADWRYGAESLERAENLRAILAISGGFPKLVDYDACFARHIRVLSVAPAYARSVAELALTFALAAGRDVVSGDRAMRAGNEQWLHAGNANAFNLFDKRVGFIGYGNIGRALQPLLVPFGVQLDVYDPWLGEGYLRSQGVNPVELDDLLANSKVIFVLAAPSSENKALISRERLMLIQPNAVFVLVSRAHVVDFDALTEFALSGRFKVATDVFPSEPLEADHPLRHAESAILSAHKAGPTIEAGQQIGRMLVDDLEAILQGLPPLRLQNAEPEIVTRYAGGTIKQRK